MSDSSPTLLPASSGKQFKLPELPRMKEARTRKYIKIALSVLGVFALGIFAEPIIAFTGNIGTILENIGIILENVLNIGLIAIAIGALYWLVRNERLRTLVKSIADGMIRKLTSMWAEMNPLVILDQYVQYVNNQIERLDAAINRLRAQIKRMKDKMKANIEGIENEARRMKVAAASQNENEKAMVVVFYRQAKRLEKRNVNAKDLLATMETVLRVLLKMRQVAQVMALDIRNEVEDMKEKTEMVSAAKQAQDAAAEIIQGNSTQRDLYNQAMSFLEGGYFQKMAELEGFVQGNEYFIATNDIENGQISGEALDFLEQWEKKGDSLLLSEDEKKEIYSNTGDMLDIDAEVERVRTERPRTSSRMGRSWTEGLPKIN